MRKMKFPIKHIVLHTASFKGRADKEMIESWHIKRGFDEIGYHFVITGSVFDASTSIQRGRAIEYQGAHSFLSNNTIGICVTGHGDFYEWSGKQYKALCSFCKFLMGMYNIPVENVIGHRDTRWQKLNPNKTCPGKLINMDIVRMGIKAASGDYFKTFYED